MRGITFYASLAFGALVIVEAAIAALTQQPLGACLLIAVFGCVFLLGAYTVIHGIDTPLRVVFCSLGGLMFLMVLAILADGRPNIYLAQLFGMAVTAVMVGIFSPEENRKPRRPRPKPGRPHLRLVPKDPDGR